MALSRRTHPRNPPMQRPPVEFLTRIEASGWSRVMDFIAATGSRFYLYRKGRSGRLLIEVHAENLGFEVWVPVLGQDLKEFIEDARTS